MDWNAASSSNLVNRPEQLPGRLVTAIRNAAIDDMARAILLSGSSHAVREARHRAASRSDRFDDCAVVAEIITSIAMGYVAPEHAEPARSRPST